MGFKVELRFEHCLGRPAEKELSWWRKMWRSGKTRPESWYYVCEWMGEQSRKEIEVLLAEIWSRQWHNCEWWSHRIGWCPPGDVPILQMMPIRWPRSVLGDVLCPTETLGGVLRFASEILVPLMHLILETICKTREAWGGEWISCGVLKGNKTRKETFVLEIWILTFV